jgi:glutamate dehydrogenase
VIGEGGNLGLTQRARISFALRGGRLNTDALDNSAGVDMSDHEVNLKILLAPLVRSGSMEMEERNVLLERVGPEVSRLVLRNNVSQSLAVSLDDPDELEDRLRDGLGLTRPTLCVLLAYAKLYAKRAILASSLPNEPATQEFLVDYFPAAAVEVAGVERLREHRLRREIVATQVVNSLVDIMGASFIHRVARDTGRSADRVITAWFIAREISGAAEVREALQGLEGRYASEIVHRWHFGMARVLDRTTRWTLANVEPEAATDRVIADLRHGLSRLRGDFGRLVSGEDRELFQRRVDELKEIGVGGPFAEQLITLRFLPELLDILRIAREAGDDAIETATTYYAVADQLSVTWLQHALRAVSRDELWDKRLIETLDADLHRAHRAIARRVLAASEGGESIPACIDAYRQRRSVEASLFEELIQELRSSDPVPLAAFAVSVRALVALSEA